MTAAHTIEALEALLTADDNLLLWRSHKDSGPNLFFVWSTKLGDGLAKGKPTIAEAVVAFKENNAEALKRPSPEFFHSSSDPKSRPPRSHQESHGVINQAAHASKSPEVRRDLKLTPDRARVATAMEGPAFVSNQNIPRIVASEAPLADLRALV